MKRITRHFSTPAARNSTLFFFGSLAINFGRYFFHVLLLRFLTPDTYGEFLSYISLIYLLTIPSGVIQTLVSRNVSLYFGRGDRNKINNFFYYISSLTLLPAVIIAVLVVILAHPLSSLLKANPTAFIVLSIMTVFSLLGAVIRSYLPALQKFVTQIVIGAVELIVLLITVFILLKLNLQALSGIMAMLISSTLSLSLTLYFIKEYIYPKLNRITPVKIGKFLLHSFIFSTGTLSLMSTDILMARYFLTAHDSGLYSALSIIGRMIFFGLTPIAGLILPIAASRYAKGQNTATAYNKLMLAASVLGLAATVMFSVLPELVVRLLSGTEYLAITSLVPYVSLTMFIFALNHLTLSYFLAVGKESATYLLLIFATLQPILITIYHQSIYQIVTLNLTLQLCLLLTLLLYNKRKTKNETQKSQSKTS